jgi:hypothetical protein
MKVAALAALSVLIVLPADAGQGHRQSDSPVAACDNDGHCTTFAAAVPASSPRKSRPKIHNTIAAATPAAGSAATPISAVPPTATSATENPAATDATAAASTTDATPDATDTTTAIATDSAIAVPVPLPTPKPRAAALDANGNAAGVIISSKTGARARVGVAYAARFQAYIDDLEKNHGARILFMGGIRPGRCSVASEHPCGKALDVCQLRRGAIDLRCNLPGRAALGQIAAAHGLFEGGRWCDSDYGHAQIGVTAPACGGRWPVRLVQQ